MALWETRTQEAAKLATSQSIPDFAAKQAEHLSRIAVAREAAKAKATQPKTPGLKTKTRVKQRHAFDEQIKEKEKIVIKLREANLKEREEQARQEIRELRKKLDANVRANPVPDWYGIDSDDDEIQILD